MVGLSVDDRPTDLNAATHINASKSTRARDATLQRLELERGDTVASAVTAARLVLPRGKTRL